MTQPESNYFAIYYNGKHEVINNWKKKIIIIASLEIFLSIFAIYCNKATETKISLQ